MKLLKPAFIPKLIMAFFVLVELALIVIGYLYVADLLVVSEADPNLVLFIFAGIIVVNILCSIYIINSTVSDAYKITWLFFVNALPLIGFFFYLIFANKQTSRSQRRKYIKWSRNIQKEDADPAVLEMVKEDLPGSAPLIRYLASVSGSGIYRDTSVEYFSLGDYAFPKMLEELKKAKHYIFMEFFIYAPGVFWDSILEILKEKAAQGVDVRVLYDDVGCLGTLPFDYKKELEKFGIKAGVFEPFRPLLDIRMNNRDHRKIMVIDGHTCFTGGCNIADEYINKCVRFGHWKDNMIMLKGQGVYGFTLMFLSTWCSLFTPNEKIDRSAYLPAKYIDEAGGFPKSDGYVQPFGDLPYDDDAVGETVYLSLIQHAESFIYISTPYLLIDSKMESALINAALSGVEVHILTPHIPDKKAVFHMTRSYYGGLLKAGVHIHEYTPGFVHEKTFLVDGKVATVGTINLDYRSLYLHSECGTLLVNCKAVDDMKKDFEDTFSKSEEITREHWEKWYKRHMAYWAVLRIFAPLM
jgi:cardiolipin synthase